MTEGIDAVRPSKVLPLFAVILLTAGGAYYAGALFSDDNAPAVVGGPAADEKSLAADQSTAETGVRTPFATPAAIPVATVVPRYRTEPAAPQRVWKRGSFCPGFKPAPPASAEVRAVSRSEIPRDVYQRLQDRLAEAARGGRHGGIGRSRPPLPPVDPTVAKGVKRPFGADRIIHSGAAVDVPAEARASIRKRSASRTGTGR